MGKRKRKWKKKKNLSLYINLVVVEKTSVDCINVSIVIPENTISEGPK